MLKIATHNSGTGEKGKDFLSWLVTPFARCQDKTLVEQYEAGCTFFDLRLKPAKDGCFYLGHGIWTSEMKFEDALDVLDEAASKKNDTIYILAVYEGSLDVEYYGDFIEYVEAMVKCCEHIKIVYIAVKKPVWKNIAWYNNIPFEADYAMITGWKCLLPIPRFWKMLQGDVEFDEEVYKMVDFL